MIDAWSTRPSRTVTQKLTISATRSVSISRTVYTDTLLIDRMADRGQLSDRQHVVACRLHRLFLAAGLTPRVTARQDVVPEEPVEETVNTTSMDRDEAKSAYRRNLRNAGDMFGAVLEDLMHNQHPGVRRLATAQAALDFLGDQWGVEKQR